MRIAVPLIATLIVIASAGQAAAGVDPISLYIEASFFSLLVSAGVSVSAAVALTPLLIPALVIGAGALSYMAAGNRSGAAAQAIDQGRMKELIKTDNSPEIRLIGRGVAAGALAFPNTESFNRWRLTGHCKGPVDATEAYFLGGREVTVEEDGAVSSPPWGKPGGSYCYLYEKKGDGSETAWPALIAAFPTLWTAAHRLRGVAQTLAKFISPGVPNSLFFKLYQGGVPVVSKKLRGELALDPRDGAVRWTDNGIVNVWHVIRSFPEYASLDLWDIPFIAAEADRADALVTRRGGGTTARSRAWGFWSMEAARGTTIQQMLDSIGAMIVLRRGDVVDGIQQVKFGLQLVDDEPESEFDIPARHLIEIRLKAGPEGVERPNLCRIKNYSPERHFKMEEINMDGVAWARVESEIARYGEKPFDVELPHCPDAGQAQRIARQLFAQARADSGVAITNFYGRAAWGVKFARIEDPDFGWMLCRIGKPRILDNQDIVQIPFIVWPDLSGYNPAVDEAPAPAQLPDFAYDSLLTEPAAPTATAKVNYPDGNFATRLAFVIPPDAATAEVVYRTYNIAGLPESWHAMTVYVSPGGFVHAYVALDLFGKVCDFRLRTFSGDNGSIWSPLYHTTVVAPQTAPGAPTISLEEIVVAEVPRVLVSVTAPGDLTVAYVVITGGGSLEEHISVKPGEPKTLQVDVDAGAYTAQAFASDGTGGPVASAVL